MVPVEILERLTFLEGFPSEYLEPLASVARLVDVAAEEVIFNEGEKSPSIFLVVEGKVSLEVWVTGRGVIRIQTAGPGRMLGWTPLLTQEPMTATARALVPTRLVAVNAMQVLDACAVNPRFGMEFMRRTALALSRRLEGTRRQLLDVSQDQLPLFSE